MKVTLPAAVVLVLSIWFLCAGCKNSTGPSDSNEPPEEYIYTQPPETDDGWETASLVDTGFDVSRLESLMNAVRNGTYDALHGLLIVQQGKLVFEQYFPGYASSGGRQEGAGSNTIETPSTNANPPPSPSGQRSWGSPLTRALSTV